MASLRLGALELTENEISRHIVECAIEVHRILGGPGLLESEYEQSLAWEIKQRGLSVERRVRLPIPYKGQTLASSLRIDLIALAMVIVECKAVAVYNNIFEAQVLTYFRLTGLKLDLVVNVGERVVKDGIHRVANRLLRKDARNQRCKEVCGFASSRPCANMRMLFCLNWGGRRWSKKSRTRAHSRSAAKLPLRLSKKSVAEIDPPW